MIYPYILTTLTIEILQNLPCQHYIYTSAKKSSIDRENVLCSQEKLKITQEVTNPEFSPIPPNKNNQKTTDTSAKQTEENKNQFTILPIGFNLDKRNVNESVLIRGFEDGNKAVNFDNWLLPFDDVISALKITKTVLEDGQIELRSPGLVKRINPQELKTDPELGLVLSVAEIKNNLGVPTEFDIVKYAVVFNPPWLGMQKQGNNQQEQPVILDGLPKVNPPIFNISNIGQNINISGNNNSTTSQGDLTTIGTIFGGSWYVRTNQPKLTDRSSWNISEAQYLRQTDRADYVVGSQPTFWQSQGGGQYWGLTTVQRFGYNPPTTSGSGFSPSQRMQPNQIGRTIAGEAAPGTLVQLLQGLGDDVVGEVLVDSSGVYRFENIPTGGVGGSNNYRVRLYPNGQLTATPEVREANFSSLPGQLTKGTSALIISSGFSRENSGNSFIGNFTDWRGGATYRLGLSEDLTVGTGVIYDESLLGLGEIFYQPPGLPLQVAFSGLLGTKKGFKYNANIRFQPARNLNFSFNSDELSQRFRANWQPSGKLRFRVSGDTRQNTLAAGINISHTQRNFSTVANADIDTKNNLRWSLNSRLQKLQISLRGNEISTNSLVSYHLSRNTSVGNSLHFGYETRNNNDNLGTLSWRYRSPQRTRDGRNLWDVDLGYGIGSQGNGFIASASTAFIPGLNVRLRYEGISATSNGDNFSIDLSPSFGLQPRLTPSDSRYERFRSEGGLLIQPFLDKNGNGKLDKKEKIHTEDAELLLTVNNKPIKSFGVDTRKTKSGVLIKLTPDNYRIDLDPAGYPINWKPIQSAYGVEVAAGSYTPIQIPFSPSYTVAGTLTNAEGKPIEGARVEAVLKDKDQKIISITNGAGIFFLENLQQGTYNLLINDKPAQPEKITIDSNSEPMQEVNLKWKTPGRVTQQ